MTARQTAWLAVALAAFIAFAIVAARLFVIAGGAVPISAGCHC